jgi:hypothetical protein
MILNAISSQELQQRWKNMIQIDPNTYNEDFLKNQFQKKRLQEFLNREKTVLQKQNRPFDPVETIQRFQSELKKFPDFPDPISEADHAKVEFIQQHPHWMKILSQ